LAGELFISFESVIPSNRYTFYDPKSKIASEKKELFINSKRELSIVFQYLFFPLFFLIAAELVSR
jgi:hypothetical protein